MLSFITVFSWELEQYLAHKQMLIQHLLTKQMPIVTVLTILDLKLDILF